jgi:outer membrane protein OmpA-like peptidoglycan-associated protein
MYRHALSLIMFIVLCILSLSAFAANRFDVTGLRPSPYGGAFPTLLESNSLKQWESTVGTALSYGYMPLNSVLSGSNVTIVKRYIKSHFYGAIGITDWLDLSFDMPIVWHSRFRNPDTSSAAASKIGLGDLQISSKISLLKRSDLFFGLALEAFMSVPIGQENYFMGNDGITGGGKIILDGTIGTRLSWAVNLGVLARKYVSAYGINFNEQLLTSAGVSVKTTDYLSFIGEVNSTTTLNDFYQSKETSPTELRAGMQWSLGKNKNIQLNTSGNIAVAYGSGTPQYGALVGVTLRMPRPKKKAKSTPVPIERLLHFGFDSTTIVPESTPVLVELTQCLSAKSSVKSIIIKGHTDNIGSRKYNMDLSARRAEAIKQYIINRKLFIGEIKIVSCGEDYPVDTNKTRQGRAKNRRVEIIVK